MLVSMDMSMRSSGLVALTPDDAIEDFTVFKTTKEDFPDDEDLIIHVRTETLNFIKSVNADNFVIEGLSYAGKSSRKDVIAGLFWGIRTEIRTKCPDILIGVVPVTSWRSKVLDKDDRKFAKENFTPAKEAIKIATVSKLPPEINQFFLDYINRKGYDLKTMYDLADAYFLGKYRNSLDK
jgi:hypothetical protein